MRNGLRDLGRWGLKGSAGTVVGGGGGVEGDSGVCCRRKGGGGGRGELGSTLTT